MTGTPYLFKADFDATRTEIDAQHNDLLLYAMGYYLDADPKDLKATDLTDGTGDQSADFVHIDLESQRAIIAQATLSNEWFKNQGEPTKATMLSQAVNWLLVAPIESVPERIAAKAVELRSVIESGDIDKIELVYVHNAFESKAMSDELNVVASSFNRTFSTVAFSGWELGANKIESLYQSATSVIAVPDEVVLPIVDCIETSSEGRWKAYVAVVPATAIYDLYDRHRETLFSANVRDYLGTKNSAKKINGEMKETAQSKGSDFFVFNNGITLLTHSAVPQEPRPEFGKALKLSGISIINGAQTTGTLFDSSRAACESIQLQCRVLESSDPDLLALAVKYNNTQNAVKASDRRSNDETQKRLNREFLSRGVLYVARRSYSTSGATSYKLDADTMAQSLCSFGGDLTTATRNRSRIWDEKTIYDRVFPKLMPWSHVWLVHLVSIALDGVVDDIKARAKADTATSRQKAQATLMSFSPSKQAVLFMFGKLAEQILGRSVRDPYLWCAKDPTVSGRRQELVVALSRTLIRIISRVANPSRDEAAAYTLVRTQALVEHVLEDLGSRFEEDFDDPDLDYIKTLRDLTYIQVP